MSNLEDQLIDIITQGRDELRAKHNTDDRDYKLYLHENRLKQLYTEIESTNRMKEAFPSSLKDVKRITYMGIELNTHFPLYDEVWMVDDRLVRQNKFDDHVLKFKIK